MTVAELIEYLSQFPDDTKCTYDDGNGLVVEYDEERNAVDFH